MEKYFVEKELVTGLLKYIGARFTADGKSFFIGKPNSKKWTKYNIEFSDTGNFEMVSEEGTFNTPQMLKMVEKI